MDKYGFRTKTTSPSSYVDTTPKYTNETTGEERTKTQIKEDLSEFIDHFLTKCYVNQNCDWYAVETGDMKYRVVSRSKFEEKYKSNHVLASASTPGVSGAEHILYQRLVKQHEGENLFRT